MLLPTGSKTGEVPLEYVRSGWPTLQSCLEEERSAAVVYDFTSGMLSEDSKLTSPSSQCDRTACTFVCNLEFSNRIVKKSERTKGSLYVYLYLCDNDGLCPHQWTQMEKRNIS